MEWCKTSRKAVEQIGTLIDKSWILWHMGEARVQRSKGCFGHRDVLRDAFRNKGIMGSSEVP